MPHLYVVKPMFSLSFLSWVISGELGISSGVGLTRRGLIGANIVCRSCDTLWCWQWVCYRFRGIPCVYAPLKLFLVGSWSIYETHCISTTITGDISRFATLFCYFWDTFVVCWGFPNHSLLILDNTATLIRFSCRGWTWPLLDKCLTAGISVKLSFLYI